MASYLPPLLAPASHAQTPPEYPPPPSAWMRAGQQPQVGPTQSRHSPDELRPLLRALHAATSSSAACGAAAPLDAPLPFVGREAWCMPVSNSELVHAFPGEAPVRAVFKRLPIRADTGKITLGEIASHLQCTVSELQSHATHNGMGQSVTIVWNKAHATLNAAAQNEFPCLPRGSRLTGDVVVVPYGCM